jgi:hypothetical protein
MLIIVKKNYYDWESSRKHGSHFVFTMICWNDYYYNYLPCIILDGLQEDFKSPCVVFAGHPSLRMGDAVHFLEMWGGSSTNTIIFTGNCLSNGYQVFLMIICIWEIKLYHQIISEWQKCPDVAFISISKEYHLIAG